MRQPGREARFQRGDPGRAALGRQGATDKHIGGDRLEQEPCGMELLRDLRGLGPGEEGEACRARSSRVRWR